MLSLQHLRVLILMGNPLAVVIVVPKYSKLALLDLQHIYYYNELIVSFSPNVLFDLVIEVSDSNLCCMLPENTGCSIRKESKMKCYGLLETRISQIVFYSLSSLSVGMSLATFYTQVINIKTKAKTTTHSNKYYLIILFNQIVSNIINALYLAAIGIADSINVNVLFFRESFFLFIFKCNSFYFFWNVCHF